MSAAEKILALTDYSELNMPSDYIDRLDVITDVLPLIADLVAAAEAMDIITVSGLDRLAAALAVLDKVLP